MVYLFLFFISYAHANLEICKGDANLAARTCDEEVKLTAEEKRKSSSDLLHYKGRKCEPMAESVEIAYKNVSREESKALGPHTACIEKSISKRGRGVKSATEHVSYEKVEVKKLKTTRYFDGKFTVEELTEEPSGRQIAITSSDKFRLFCDYLKNGSKKCTKEPLPQFMSDTRRTVNSIVVSEPTEEQLNQILRGEPMDPMLRPMTKPAEDDKPAAAR